MDAPVRKRLGEILIERGKLDAAGLERALRLQQESGDKLGALLVSLGVVSQRDVSEALALQLGLPLIEAAGYPEMPILEERVSARFLRDSRALPLTEDEHELALAMADPTDTYTMNAFEMVTGRKVRPLVAIPSELDAALERLYGAGKSALGQILGDVEQSRQPVPECAAKVIRSRCAQIVGDKCKRERCSKQQDGGESASTESVGALSSRFLTRSRNSCALAVRSGKGGLRKRLTGALPVGIQRSAQR